MMVGDQQTHVVAIIGPTAIGKTALSMVLAKRFDGEVISADSRQIYRHMDIGTAKATPQERRAVPHHLIDILMPDQRMTLARYKREAAQAIEDVWRRGKLPLLVGGTGLYVHAVLEGWKIPEVPPNRPLRAKLRQRAERLGRETLHGELERVDPEAAEKIHPNNVRRVVRALEVYHETGTPISELQGKEPPGYHVLEIGLTMPREALYRRIDERVDRMIAQGLVGEVQWLMEQGYGLELSAMSGLGYRQIVRYLEGEIDLDEAIRRIKSQTRRFVRQQYTWFKLSDESIHWFDTAETDTEEIVQLVARFLGT